MSTPPKALCDVRPLRRGDEVADDLPRPRQDDPSSGKRRSLVAVREDLVIGSGSMTLAPGVESYFAEVRVSAGHRRKGVGTALFDALFALVGPMRVPVVGRVMASQPQRRAFADSLGCTVLAHCPVPYVAPTADEVRAWASLQSVPAGWLIAPIGDLDDDQLASAWADLFTWTHQPFGRVMLDQLPQMWTSYRVGCDPAVSTVCLDSDGRVVALSLVSLEAWEHHNLMVTETVRRDQPNGAAAVAAVVAGSLTQLANRGVTTVEIEGHSTDVHISELIESLPTSGSDPMDIMVFGQRVPTHS
ncbi:GNAT family N-acetyltransferase [Propionibacteriaceae bacterium Y1685]